MANLVDLNRRVLQAFPELGLDIGGTYIGKKPFKARCIQHFSKDGAGNVRQSVNWLVKNLQIPYHVKNFVPPPAPTVPFEEWVTSEVVSYRGQEVSKKQLKKLVANLMGTVPQCYTAVEIAGLDLVVTRIVAGGKAAQPASPKTTAFTAPQTSASGFNRRKASVEPNPHAWPSAPTQPTPSSVPPSWNYPSAAKRYQPPSPVIEPIQPPRNPRIEELNAATRRADDSAYQTESTPASDYDVGEERAPLLEDQLCLLSTQDDLDSDIVDETDIQRAVLFTADVLDGNRGLLPQFGLLGGMVADGGKRATVDDGRVFLNTNHPCSFFICGLQGSGKSHSTSTLLENFLIPSRTLGVLAQPLSGLVFHYGQFTSRQSFRPCEAAFLAFPNPRFQDQFLPVPVTVLVSPSNFLSLNGCYSQIPGVTVRPLRIPPELLNIGSILTLMSVDQSSGTPLYLSQVTKVLRDMASVSPTLNFMEFKWRLSRLDLSPMQRRPLEQRLDLLQSFLDLDGRADDSSLAFAEGSLTIVDLSCPFVDENTACVLFEICLGIFLGDSDSATGKVIALDEAHKYIIDTPASKSLTESLLTTIRQQRHYGARVIIATQEPTIDPRLMDLSSVTLIHRFTSPDWFSTLKKHVSVLEDDELFRRIVNLRVGEALAFAPSAICLGEKLNSRLLGIKVRRRVTWDGGKSIMSV